MKRSPLFEIPDIKPRSNEEEWTLLVSSDPARHHSRTAVPFERDQEMKIDDELVKHARLFAEHHGLNVHVRPAAGAVRLSGETNTARNALHQLRSAARREPGKGMLPRAMASLGPRVVTAVLRQPSVARESRWTVGLPGELGLFTAPMLKEGYRLPKGDGMGQRIGVILLGGGFDLDAVKPGLDTYFKSIGLVTPSIKVTYIRDAPKDPASIEEIEEHVLLVGGVRGRPAPLHPGFVAAARERQPTTSELLKALATERDNVRWTGEGLMDVELIGSIANDAEIFVYIARNMASDIFETIVHAVEVDGCTVINCSFGAAESKHQPNEMLMIDAALMFAAKNKVTVCASTGDQGCTAGTPGRYAVEYPASSPWALAVGGTTLKFRSDTPPLSWDREIAWSETIHGVRRAGGGGFSARYSVPSWQKDVLAREHKQLRTRRGTPDVASAAALASGCWIWFGGREQGVNTMAAGTSAAVPVWSALVALLNEALETRLGLLAPRLYHPEIRPHFFDIREGTNRMGKLKRYRARSGWNPCTGIGTPRGDSLLAALKSVIQHRAPAPGPAKQKSIRS